jgi:hypothetical protein
MSTPADDQEKAKARRVQLALYILTFLMIAVPLLIFWLQHVKT